MRRTGNRDTEKLQNNDAEECRKESEHDIQNSIRIALSKLGYTVFRANVGKFLLKDGRWFDVGLPEGFSDLMAIKDGKVYFLEVKASKGRASKAQVNFIEQMKIKGCKAGIVYSVEEAIKILEEVEG